MLNRNSYIRLKNSESVLIIGDMANSIINQADYRIALCGNELLIVRQDEIQVQ